MFLDFWFICAYLGKLYCSRTSVSHLLNHSFCLMLLIVAENWQFSGSLTPMAGGVHLCYYQKAGDSVQMGIELEGSLRTQECTATIGYQIDLPKSNLAFRGWYTLYVVVVDLKNCSGNASVWKQTPFSSLM